MESMAKLLGRVMIVERDIERGLMREKYRRPGAVGEQPADRFELVCKCDEFIRQVALRSVATPSSAAAVHASSSPSIK